jgi:hypothetical protein
MTTRRTVTGWPRSRRVGEHVARMVGKLNHPHGASLGPRVDFTLRLCTHTRWYVLGLPGTGAELSAFALAAEQGRFGMISL